MKPDPSAGARLTPARRALIAYAEAWTYPILGNEDVPVVHRLFGEAYELARGASPSLDDPPVFGQWLKTLREARHGSEDWEDVLFAVAEHFGFSTDQ
jgi:hypothetical protein